MQDLQHRGSTMIGDLGLDEGPGAVKLNVALRRARLAAVALTFGMALTGFAHAQSSTATTASAHGSPRSAPAFYRTDGDREFARPFVDGDAWRAVPVHHRYVHGGFTGTDTRFSSYFPDRADYKERFVQHISPVPDDEKASQKLSTGEANMIAFAIAHGASFIGTNDTLLCDAARETEPAGRSQAICAHPDTRPVCVSLDSASTPDYVMNPDWMTA